MAALLFSQLRLPGWGAIVGLAIVGVLLLIASHNLPLVYLSYLKRLALALAGLLVLTWAVLPVLLRVAAPFGSAALLRSLWALALLACALRLVGALYPLFRAYDLPLNVERLLNVVNGILVATNRSFEFRGGETIYPPGPYLVLLPWLLLGFTPSMLVQASMAMIDGLSVLGIAALALVLGLRERAVIVVALLSLALPISLTSLYYGHSAQIFGQALLAPLAALLVIAFEQRRIWPWVAAGTVLSIALLSHIGVSVLAVSWLAIVWLLLSVRRDSLRQVWWRLTIMLLVCGGLAALLVYGAVIPEHLEQLQQIGAASAAGGNRPAYNLIARAYWISYTPAVLVLAVPGLLLLLLNARTSARLLIGGWLAAAALFSLIELATGLQVRYLLFLVPLVTIGVGYLTEYLSAKPTLRSTLTYALVVVVLTQGCVLWYTGTFQNVAPSMVPLLR